MFLKPYSLPANNLKIGIFQTSESDAQFPIRRARALRQLARLFPDAQIRDYTQYENPLGTHKASEELARRFHLALRENHLLISLTGGYTTNCILPYVDYNLVRNTKRIITGYSDTTALLMAIMAKSGLVVMHGVALLGSFGEYPEMNSDTALSFKEILLNNTCRYSYRHPNKFADCDFFWDRQDMQPLEYRGNMEWVTNADSTVTGVLYGGNMNTLLAIANTEFFPDIRDGILLLEDAHTSLYQIKRDFESLRQKGILKDIRGAVIGKMFQSGGKNECIRINEHLLSEFDKLGIPAMVNVDFGHCAPQMTIPLGIQVSVDYANKLIILNELATMESNENYFC